MMRRWVGLVLIASAILSLASAALSAGASQSDTVRVSAEILPAVRLEVVPGVAPQDGAVSASAVDFGTIGLGTAKTGSQQLTVLCNAPGGYTVTASQDGPLRSATHSIPDATGDNGTITESDSGAWIGSNTYGFGYTLENVSGSAAAFTGGYRQFADTGAGETPQTVMSGVTPTDGDVTSITFKLNVSGAQAPGTYANTITYIATGNY
jgi:hypothetical protein